MLTVSATEFQKNFAKYQDAALVQPVTVTQNGRERIVVLSADRARHIARCRATPVTSCLSRT